MRMFINLSPVEEAKFRKWARDNYKPLSNIDGIWHPIVQDECVKMNIEYSNGFDADKELKKIPGV